MARVETSVFERTVGISCNRVGERVYLRRLGNQYPCSWHFHLVAGAGYFVICVHQKTPLS